jgi:N-acetylgalactosamine kinase
MPTEIGERSVDEYRSLTTAASRGERNVFLDRATARHGSRERAVDSGRRFARLIDEFAQRFGHERPICLHESPGRVNLMGMHIDHRGGIVNPVATRERIRAVCSRREDDVICARSLSGNFGEGEFRISERLPPRPLRSLSHWLDWTEKEAVLTGGGRHFINYFACGPLYCACFRYPWGRQFAGADFLMESDLPPSSGLSSSSAVVVLATDFFLRCNPQGVGDLPVDQRLEIYGYGEWYIGTRGGTGDHAAIKLCRRGAIQPIITTPQFAARRPAPVPDGCDILLYPSGDAANKSVEPYKTAFNAPIISYQAAEMMLTDYVRRRTPKRLEALLARRAAMDARHHRVYLGDVVNDVILQEPEICEFLRSVPRVMTREEIFLRFRDHAEVFQAGIQQASEPKGGYHVRDVAAYGLSECARAREAGPLLAEGDIEGFAEMMNVSQLGDRVTEVTDEPSRRIKSLQDDALSAMEQEGIAVRRIAGDYHVSTANVDRMVSLCLGCPGVLGARLSGAGLGGMLIVLGEEGFDEALDLVLQRHYYEPLEKEFQKTRIVPSEGAGFY